MHLYVNEDYFSILGTNFLNLIITQNFPRGSILGSLLFLTYINDQPQALSEWEVKFYANDTSISYSHQKLTEIELFWTKTSLICDWIVDNYQIILKKIKRNLFFSQKNDKQEKLKTMNNSGQIKHHNSIEYLGCILDRNLTVKVMMAQVSGKIITKYNFLHRHGDNWKLSIVEDAM